MMSVSVPALEAIWHAFSSEVRAFLLSRLPSEMDAEDILQDVFMRVHEKIGSVREAEKLESWVYQIARNAIADFYRRRVPQATDVAEDTADKRCLEEAANKNGAVAAWLPLLIENLPESAREAVRMYEIEDRPQAEIAARLNISLPAAKSRIQRARRQLEDLLRQSCEIELDRRGNVIECKPVHAGSCGEQACGCGE